MKILIVHSSFPVGTISLEKSKEIRDFLQKDCKFYLQPTVVISSLVECWKQADTINYLLWGNNKHRWNGVDNEISHENVKERIEKEGHEIIILVVHYIKLWTMSLIGKLGCTGQENFNLVDQIDFSKNFICFDQKKNFVQVF